MKMSWVQHSIGIVVSSLLSIELVVIGKADEYLFEIERKTPINFECDHEQCMRTSHAIATYNPTRSSCEKEHLRTERCVKRIIPDGNCLFRSISYFLHRSEDYYDEVRQDIVNHVVLNWSDYESFIVGLNVTYPAYVDSADKYKIYMSGDRIWGDHIEVTAATHTYQIRLHVFYDQINFHKMGEEYKRTFALLYRGQKDHGHYSVIEDICVPYYVDSKCQKKRSEEPSPVSKIITYKRRRDRSPISRILTYSRKRLKNTA